MTADEASKRQIAGPCKICKAPAGQGCVNHHGQPLGGVHAFGGRSQRDLDLERQFRELVREPSEYEKESK